MRNRWSASAGVKKRPSGLVQDQDVGAAIQRLEDLDRCWWPTDSSSISASGSTCNSYSVASRFSSALRPPQRGAQHRPVLGPEDDVFQHGEILHQLEMLEDHADAGADRGLAVGDGDRLAADQDFAGSGR